MDVVIKRQLRSDIDAVVNIDEISSVHWDNISGGVQVWQYGYSLYGYIDYDLGYELGLCSGRHGYYGSGIKICIPAASNKYPEYQKGYRELLELAGDKPSLPPSKPLGALPLTKQICKLLSERTYERKELRDKIYGLGYSSSFATAVKNLVKQGKIIVDTNPCNPHQKISLISLDAL